MPRAEYDAASTSSVTPEDRDPLEVESAAAARRGGGAVTREQWLDTAAAIYADALRLAALPYPEDEDHDDGSAECDDYWELSDDIEEAGAHLGLTEAEMMTVITAADSEHDSNSPLAGAAVIADLAARRFGPGTQS